MSPYMLEAAAWQESWDRQQEAYMPDREERFTALLDTVDAVTAGHARYAAGAALSWADWWDHVAADPTLGPLVIERKRLFTEHHSSEWTPPVSWHLDALRAAGYAEVGLVWRGGQDAAVAAVNA